MKQGVCEVDVGGGRAFQTKGAALVRGGWGVLAFVAMLVPYFLALVTDDTSVRFGATSAVRTL